MARKRNRHTAQFKAKVALEAVKGQRTTSELSSEYQVHPTVINRWKKQLLESLPGLFQQGKKSPPTPEETLTGPLYQEIGRLKMELDWLKKSCLSRLKGDGTCLNPSRPISA